MYAHFSSHISRYNILIALLLVSSLVFLPQPAQAADGVVGTGSAASCDETAFNTVYNAVVSSGGGTITFNCGATPLTIILSYQRPVSANIELSGGDLITLSGGNTTSLFQVYGGQTFTLSHIALTHGYGNVGAIENFGHLVVQNSQLLNNAAIVSGGAISNYGEVSLIHAQLADNTASQWGGGIFSESGNITIVNSQFTHNSAFSGGGGIAASLGTTTTITSSQFTYNQVTDTFAEGGGIRSAGLLVMRTTTLSKNNGSRGGAMFVANGTANVISSWFYTNWGAYGGGIRQSGGILNLTDVTMAGNGYSDTGYAVTTDGGAISQGGGHAYLTNVTISGNWASYGGGLSNDSGTTSMTNVTLSGNEAVGGGAIDLGGDSIDLTNVTIAGNSAPFFAGGIANRAGTATLKNTLLSGNFNPDNGLPFNCYQAIASSSFSQSSDYTCGFGAGHDNLILLLGPLGNNGGFNQTHLLRPGSPAIDAGTGLGCPPADQRGVTRPQGAACDVGAVEVTPADLLSKAYLPLLVR